LRLQPQRTLCHPAHEDDGPVCTQLEQHRRGSLEGRSMPMPLCKGCSDDVEQLVTVKVDGKTKKLCESCADRAREEAEVAEESEAVVQNMMGFKGRR
jgi:hypothetical protein